jgi:UDP-N-acetyl-D-mannosaminuronate dehydrogenase
MMKKVLIIGLGEVGQALFEIFKESRKFDVFGFDLNKEKMMNSEKQLPEKVDVMHICYSCNDQETFILTTIEYIKKINPELTIIESTIPPGTTKKIFKETKKQIVHSPIRGMHRTLENMKKDILFWTKYIGGITKNATEEARKHFEKIGLNVKILKSSVETELAKLFETTYRAWMISCFQEMHRISKYFEADFNEVIDILEDIHRVRLNKPLHFPGVIGGHCLIPNVKLLLSIYDSKFLRIILESNNKRKKEIKEQSVQEEVEKVKKRMKVLQLELLKKIGNSNF